MTGSAVTVGPTVDPGVDPTVDPGRAIADVPDPEVPALTIEDLGILRRVEVDAQRRHVRVTITPTYSGCPAMAAIERGIVHAAKRAGYTCEVRSVLRPAWTTDWISERGRQRLRELGIAPPGPAAASRPAGPVPLVLQRRTAACPQCGSDDTEELARFGSTACKALLRCRDCREPFEMFKAL